MTQFKTKIKAVATMVLGVSIAGMANADATDMNQDPYNLMNGLYVADCYATLESTVNYCGAGYAKNILAALDRKPNFGKKSVVMKTWDKELNAWIYFAVNKDTKKVFYFPMGLRSSVQPYKNEKVSMPKRSSICTFGYSVDLVGDQENPSISDNEIKVDYCSKYSDTQGFGAIERVDAKTRKLAPVDKFEFENE